MVVQLARFTENDNEGNIVYATSEKSHRKRRHILRIACCIWSSKNQDSSVAQVVETMPHIADVTTRMYIVVIQRGLTFLSFFFFYFEYYRNQVQLKRSKISPIFRGCVPVTGGIHQFPKWKWTIFFLILVTKILQPPDFLPRYSFQGVWCEITSHKLEAGQLGSTLTEMRVDVKDAIYGGQQDKMNWIGLAWIGLPEHSIRP